MQEAVPRLNQHALPHILMHAPVMHMHTTGQGVCQQCERAGAQGAGGHKPRPLGTTRLCHARCAQLSSLYNLMLQRACCFICLLLRVLCPRHIHRFQQPQLHSRVVCWRFDGQCWWCCTCVLPAHRSRLGNHVLCLLCVCSWHPSSAAEITNNAFHSEGFYQIMVSSGRGGWACGQHSPVTQPGFCPPQCHVRLSDSHACSTSNSVLPTTTLLFCAPLGCC